MLIDAQMWYNATTEIETKEGAVLDDRYVNSITDLEYSNINFQILVQSDLRDITPVSVGMAEIPAGSAPQVNNQRATHLYYCCSGHGYVQINGKEYKIGPGQFFILPIRAKFYNRASSSGPWTYRWIGFTGLLAKDFESFPPVFTLPEDVAASFYDPRIPVKNLSSRLAMDLFCVHSMFYRQTHDQTDYVQWVIDRINTTYMQKISVAQLANELGLNRNHLTRVFKSRMGVNIQQHILTVRINEAKLYIKSGHSIDEAARRSGFSDRSTFTKLFHRECGFTPSQWKKLIQSDKLSRPL